MAAKAKIRRTISRVGYAPMNYNSSTDTFSYGAVTWFVHNEAGGREYTASANGEMSEIYADGVSVYASDENHGYNIELTLLNVVDDIDVCWLGNEVDANGTVGEYASNTERPRFALFIIEDTTDGVGVTHIWYNCVVQKRSDIAGKTSEGSGFDPQFFGVSIAARPIGANNLVYSRRNQKNRFVNVPFPNGTALAQFEMQGATLNKSFRGDVTDYTFTATGTTVKIVAAEPLAANAVVTITQNAATVEIGETITVADGAISVTVTSNLGGGSVTQTYHFTPAS